MGDWALAIDGGRHGLPPFSELFGWLRALELPGLVPGRSAHAPAAAAWRSALPGVRFPAVRAVFAEDAAVEPTGASLVDPDAGVRQRSRVALARSARLGAELGAEWVVVDLGPRPADAGEERWLDGICRGLFDLCREAPAIGVALATPATADAMPSLAMLEAILEDLARRRVGYWHDSGRAHALERGGGVDAGAWLERVGHACVGADLTDAVGEVSGLPAGAGEVDFAALREALPAAAHRVVRAEPFPGPGPLREALRQLRGRFP